MSEENYSVIFAGVLAPEAVPIEVKSKLARLFKTTPDRVEPLFSGRRVVIKRGLDEPTARNYLAALYKAGAVAELLDTQGNRVGYAADQGREHQSPEPVPYRAPEVDMSVAEPGALLVEPAAVPVPDIDISGLSMAEVGVTLAEPRDVDPPEFDLEGLELAPPGVDLGEPGDDPEPDIDTSHLSLGE